jgi:hypothetical protein
MLKQVTNLLTKTFEEKLIREERRTSNLTFLKKGDKKESRELKGHRPTSQYIKPNDKNCNL